MSDPTNILTLAKLCDWSNLLLAHQAAARGKGQRRNVAVFEMNAAAELLAIQQALSGGRWRPGEYRSFSIHQPKTRLISAAPFADRIVHHALCQILEPWYELRFVEDSFANRKGKGNQRAVYKAQYYARKYRYVLQLDIKKHFASIDHAILLGILARAPIDTGLLTLCRQIIEGGETVHRDVVVDGFADDDLLSALRPRGLPVGNLSSQFWSNVYLNGFDHFIKRQLRCNAYIRYVDDMLLYSNDKQQLWAWRAQIVTRLASLRLTIHGRSSTVYPVKNGIPFLGFVVYPQHLRLKRRGWLNFCRRYQAKRREFEASKCTMAQLTSVVRSWVAYASQGSSYGLRSVLLSTEETDSDR